MLPVKMRTENGSLLDFRETLYIMALAMKVISQVEAQRKILEEAVSTALELASGKSDGAEVAVSKTTGISVSTRYGEVENVEFNSDGALGITVYHQNRKGSASSTDLSPQAIARTVQAALDIARYTSPDPYAGVADKNCWLSTRRILTYSTPQKFLRTKPLNWRLARNRRHCRRTNASPIPKAVALTATTVSKFSATATACCRVTAQRVIRSPVV